MKIAGIEVKSIEVLQPERLEQIFDKFIKQLKFPKSVLDYIENNKWISIPNKNLYFNKEIMACYPNFLSSEYPKLWCNPLSAKAPTLKIALEVVKLFDEYNKHGIVWDMQCEKEGENSFYNKWHPMETNSNNHYIQKYNRFSYKNSDGTMQGYYNRDFTNCDAGLLIPIFRLGRKEDHDAFNNNNTAFDYTPETIALLLVFNDFIPDFYDEKINSEYKKIYYNIQKYKKYLKKFEMDKNKKIISKFDLNEVGKEIADGDNEKIFEENRLKFTLKNGDIMELSFSSGDITSDGDYIYRNGDKEVCSYKRDENGDLLRTGKSTLTKSNGDVEKLSYKDGVPQGKSEYKFKNGDMEKRTYKDGILDGESEYIYANGDREIRTYTDGEIKGDVVLYFANEEEPKKYRYIDGEKKDISPLQSILDVDKIRVNLNSYDESILTDPNRGHWDIDEKKDLDKLEDITGKKVYIRDAREDIKHGGIVGIDFGTKSTVVVFQDNRNQTFPMRISGGNLINEVKESDFENPTVIEFKDIKTFINDYNKKEGRPYTKWKDVMVSHTAFQNMLHGTGDEFISFISELKQWAGLKNEKLMMRDGKGVEKIFPPYMELKDGDIDPIELYAYYIGSYINNMVNGIYMEYFLSFPVTYEKAIREKILQSFERGIKKSLPVSILKDENSMKRFKVRHGANEPAAYAVCALQEYGFEVEDDEDVYYGVFDFGGGTADFDFGIWRASEDEKKFDYELTHFGAGGDRHLGGENILKELAYEILKENHELLRKKNISFAKPEWCRRFVGDEGLVDNSPEAKLNIKRMMEKLRPFWELSTENSSEDGKLKVNLYSKDGSTETGIELTISKEKIEKFIENKIEKGVKNFFMAMEKAMKDETMDKINIFLAGNSCKHPKVMELFEKHKGDFEGEIEIFPALGTKEAYEKMKEREIEINPNDPTNPTGKTGVAYGIIDSRAGGRIDIKNRDEESNIDNEINFRYYVGYEGRKKLKVVLGPQTQYEQFIHYLDTTADVFDLYYSTLPEAMESKMPIDKAVRKRIELADEYPGAKIYIKAVSPDTLNYVVTEKDIEEKEYLEEGEIKLD